MQVSYHEFPSSPQLQMHVESEHEDYAINCLACNFRCTTREELEMHIVSTHAFPCKKCPAVFQTIDLLIKPLFFLSKD